MYTIHMTYFLIISLIKLKTLLCLNLWYDFLVTYVLITKYVKYLIRKLVYSHYRYIQFNFPSKTRM